MVQTLYRHVQRIIAPNPGPLTQKGTNTYILGHKEKIIVDPGPDDDAHLEAILRAAPRIAGILVTHSHLDHSALAPRLAAAAGAEIYGYGPSKTGRSHRKDYGTTFTDGRGTDHSFDPHNYVEDGSYLLLGGLITHVHWTPGHFSNHLCFSTGNIVFTGDLVMGWSSTLISAPEGSVQDFMKSCAKLKSLPGKIYLPGHGDPIDDGHKRAEELMEHRRERARQIKRTLMAGPATIESIANRIYHDTPSHLLPAAQQNVLAHIIPMYEANNVACDGPIHPNQIFRWID